MSYPRIQIFAAAAIVAMYGAILGAMNFHLCLNDFWAWSFFASRMDFADPASLYNGFMPPGYAIVLRIMGPAREIAGAFALTLIAVFATAFAATHLAKRQGISGAVVLAALVLAVYPPFFQSGLTAGPDIVVTALVSIAIVLHWREGRTTGASVAAGILLGVAILVRGHALVAGVAGLVAVIVVERRVDRPALALLAGIVGGALVQVGVNLAAGEAAWSTGQDFNVYKMVHGMDWFAPVSPESVSASSILVDDPARFLREWAGALLRAGIWFAGPALGWIHARRHALPALERTAALSIIGGVLYAVPVSLGDSPRAMVVISLFVVVPVAGLLADLRCRRIAPAALGIAIVIAFGTVLGLRADRAFLDHNFGQAHDFTAVERRLQELGVDDAREVFTDDFDLYFRSIEGQRPLTKGGWGLIGIDGWEEEFVQLPTDDLPGFLESCRVHGVRYLALTRRSRRLGPDFSKLRYDPEAAGVKPVGEYGEFLLLALPDQP